MSDGNNKEVVTICEEELHRSKAWAYKWLARFRREGLNFDILIYKQIPILLYMCHSYLKLTRFLIVKLVTLNLLP